MNPKFKMIVSMAAFGTLSLFIRHIPLTSAEVALFRAVIALGCLMVFKGISRSHEKYSTPSVSSLGEEAFWQQKCKKRPPSRREVSPLAATEGVATPQSSAMNLKKQSSIFQNLGGELPLLFLSGAAMGFNWIFLFEAYKYTTVAVATLSYYFAPVLVTVLCPILFRERLTRKEIVCFIGATAGLVLVVNPGSVAGTAPMKGVLFGLAAAALYATVILLNKKISKVSGIDRTAMQFAAAAVVLLPYILLTSGVHLEVMNPTGWLCLLTVGLFHSGVCYALYFSALATLPGQEAAILSYVDPLVAVLVSLIVLAEPVAPLQLAGGAMILAFTLANEL